MRKSVAFVIALLLLVSHTGFALTVHYCGDRISSVTSGLDRAENCAPAGQKPCCAEKKQTHHKCCSDKTISVKVKMIDGIAKTGQADVFYAVFPPAYFNVASTEDIFRPATVAAFHCDSHAPPLFLRYCQLVFYA